jgi:hypothetical protein
MDLALVGNSALRYAIRQNLVSFPSQIPSFMNCGAAQERIVQLFFVRGWRMRVIGQRYGLNKSGVGKLLKEWRIRAVAAGYIQEIRPGLLAALASEATLANDGNDEDVCWRESIDPSSCDSDFTDAAAVPQIAPPPEAGTLCLPYFTSE